MTFLLLVVRAWAVVTLWGWFAVPLGAVPLAGLALGNIKTETCGYVPPAKGDHHEG